MSRIDKLDFQAFLAQAREYERAGDMRDGLGGIVHGVGQAVTSAVDSLGRKISEWRQNSKSDEPPTA